jgi:hypothetical protein
MRGSRSVDTRATMRVHCVAIDDAVQLARNAGAGRHAGQLGQPACTAAPAAATVTTPPSWRPLKQKVRTRPQIPKYAIFAQ